MEQKPLRFLWLVLSALVLVSVLLVACTRPGTTGTVSTASGGSSGSSGTTQTGTVQMNASNFEVSSITIKKGQMLTLVDTAAVPHIIQNGSWVNGVPRPAVEPGAPKVNVQFQGHDTKQIGPFTTAGTFHLYCTIHSGMNLTVIVQ